MRKLVRGIEHFKSSVFTSRPDLYTPLAQGQHPHTLFITCSDSRIDPNLLTQCDPGELFILRNAGNLVPPHGASSGGEEATIEYSVAVLGVQDIVVCGHTLCGAMKGLLQPESLTELPAVASWLMHAESTRRIIKDHYGQLPDPERLTAAVEENVLQQLDNLRTLPAVASRLVQGNLNLHGWVYKLETGEVFAYDSEQAQFAPMSEDHIPLTRASVRGGKVQAI